MFQWQSLLELANLADAMSAIISRSSAAGCCSAARDVLIASLHIAARRPPGLIKPLSTLVRMVPSDQGAVAGVTWILRELPRSVEILTRPSGELGVCCLDATVACCWQQPSRCIVGPANSVAPIWVRAQPTKPMLAPRFLNTGNFQTSTPK